MPDSSQVFLRELDKKLWTAADRLRSNSRSLRRHRSQQDNGEPFGDKIQKPGAKPNGQFAEFAKLEAQIKRYLEGLGYAL